MVTMVRKNLTIYLVLLWITLPCEVWRHLHTTFRKTPKVEYRKEDSIWKLSSTCTALECEMMETLKDGDIPINRHKRSSNLQYRHERKEDVTGFIPKPVARPEYGTIYQHKGMLLQNLHRRYLYILITLPHLKDLEQRIQSFPE